MLRFWDAVNLSAARGYCRALLAEAVALLTEVGAGAGEGAWGTEDGELTTGPGYGAWNGGEGGGGERVAVQHGECGVAGWVSWITQGGLGSNGGVAG